MPGFGRLEDGNFQASLGYTTIVYLKQKHTEQKCWKMSRLIVSSDTVLYYSGALHGVLHYIYFDCTFLF